MRRKEKEITAFSDIEDVIKKGIVCRLALHDYPYPYIVPVNYGYSDKELFFHCANEGKKLDLIKNNNNVCFEIEVDVDLVSAEKACAWGMTYRSVIGYGNVILLTDIEEKRKALDTIMKHYSPEKWEYPDMMIDTVVVFKIAIDSITGKKSGV